MKNYTKTKTIMAAVLSLMLGGTMYASNGEIGADNSVKTVKSSAMAAVVVANNNDSGAGSLRDAINTINGSAAGTHTITFAAGLAGQTITYTSEFPTITAANLTINGDINNDGTPDITLLASGGNFDGFNVNSTATGGVIKGFNFLNQEIIGINFIGAMDGYTLEDLTFSSTVPTSNPFDRVINFNTNASNIIIKNLTASNVNGFSVGAIDFAGTTTNVSIDNYQISNTAGGNLIGVRFHGVANTISVTNSSINLDAADNGAFGIVFNNTVTDLTVTNVDVFNVDANALNIANKTTNATITDFVYVNGDASISGIGINMQVVDNVTIKDSSLSMDNTASNDDGDHGIYISSNATNLTIDKTSVSGIDITALHVGGFLNTASITDFTSSNHSNTSGNGIYVAGVVTDATITNVNFDMDFAGNIDNGNYGIVFDSSASNLNISKAVINGTDISALRIDGNLTGTNSISEFTLTKHGTGLHQGMIFGGAVSNLTMSKVNLDMDQAANSNEGDYGVLFQNAVTNLNVDDITVNKSDIAAFQINGVATDITITNSNLDAGTDTSGQFGFRFGSASSNINIDKAAVLNANDVAFDFVGNATDVTVTNSSSTNNTGSVNQTGVFFRAEINGLVMTDVDLDLDFDGSTDDGNYAIRFNNAINSDVTKTAILTRVTTKSPDEDGIGFFSSVRNLTIEDCTISNTVGGTNLKDGIEFYGNHQRNNVVINNSTFTANGRAAIVFASNFTADVVTISNNTFTGGVYEQSPGTADGIFLVGGNVVKADLNITGNTFSGNERYGINNTNYDGVTFSQNIFFDNGNFGIANLGNGNNELTRAKDKVVYITNSADAGSGNATISFDIPSGCSNCDVEFFRNNQGDRGLQGREYAGVVTGLATGSHTAVMPVAGNTTGFWTATFTNNSLDGGTSEFGNSYAITPIGPGGVVDKMKVWVRADENTYSDSNTVHTGTTAAAEGAPIESWVDASGGAELFYQNVGATTERPTFRKIGAGLNFNSGVSFENNAAGMQSFLLSNTGQEYSFAVVYTSDVANPGVVRAVTGSNNWLIGAYGGKDRYYAVSGFIDNETLVTPVAQARLAIATNNGTASAFYVNGENRTANASHVGAPAKILLGAAAGANSSNPVKGDIAEVIFFSKTITTEERQKINSYLGVKYGITLSQLAVATDNGEGDYILSDGTVIFDAFAAGTINAYNKNIIAIAKDDTGKLNQRISKSVNGDGIVTISLDNNFTAANNDALRTVNHANDKQALVFSANADALNTQTTELNASLGFNIRVAREWKADLTNFSQVVSLKFEGCYEGWSLIKSSDDDFGTAPTVVSVLDANGVAENVTLEDNTFYTLAKFAGSPGAISSNLSLWLKGDAGLVTSGSQVTTWKDQSANGNITAQATKTVGTGIDFKENAMNYTQGVDFIGTSGRSLKGTVANASEWGGALTIYAVTDSDVGTGFGGPFTTDSKGIHVSEDKFIMDGITASTANSANSTDTPIGPQMVVGTYQGDNTNGTDIYVNGSLNESFTGGGVTTGQSTTFEIGGRTFDTPGRILNGRVLEVVVYKADHSIVAADVDRQKINSYLGLKYGISISQTPAATDYVDSDGTAFWVSTDNTGYKVNIFGIGRDDAQELDRRVSKSVKGNLLHVATENNFTNVNNDALRTVANANDKQFFMLASNDAAAATEVTTELDTSDGLLSRLSREWKVDKTANFTQDVTLKFDGYDNTWSLITTTDGDFSAGITKVGALAADGTITVTGAQLADGITFTIAKSALQPIIDYADNGMTAPTKAQYDAAGVTGVTAANLTCVNAKVEPLVGTDVDTKAEVQALVDEVVNVEAAVTSAGNSTLTQGELTTAGVTQTGLSPTEISAVQTAINMESPKPCNTPELQAVVDAALAALSVVDFTATEFTMYPNPSSDVVTISVDVESVTVYDISGKQVLETRSNVFNIAQLKSGLYLVNVVTDKGSAVRKLVKN